MRRKAASVALVMGMLGGMFGVLAAPVHADSRCDQHYSHTHGYSWWQRTDRYQSHGYGTNAWGLWDHWADHENSSLDWCDY